MRTFLRSAQTLPQVASEQDVRKAVEPSYEKLGTPNALRRMARSVKMGLSVSLAALEEAGLTTVDAIITATGFGCLEESERFLLDVAANGEQFLTPTAFSQSTHNTVASQLSQKLGCHGYNTVYVDRSFSFENALLDAQLLLREGEAKNVLVCAVDELTAQYVVHRRAAGHMKHGPIGEGASAFILSSESGPVELESVKTWYRPESLPRLEAELVLLGMSGDPHHDAPLRPFQENAVLFKKTCGELDTASAFALCQAYQALTRDDARTVAILNGYKGVEFSLQQLRKS